MSNIRKRWGVFSSKSILLAAVLGLFAFVGTASAETTLEKIKRTGKTVTIWGVFVLTLIIVGVVGGSTYHLVGTLSEGPGSRNIEEIYIWSYILLGLSISLIQGAVAHTNWTGRYNLISTAVAHTYRWVSRIKRFD